MGGGGAELPAVAKHTCPGVAQTLYKQTRLGAAQTAEEQMSLGAAQAAEEQIRPGAALLAIERQIQGLKNGGGGGRRVKSILFKKSLLFWFLWFTTGSGWMTLRERLEGEALHKCVG